MSNAASHPPAASADPSGKTLDASAFRRPRALALFLLVAAAGLAADLASKHYVFAWLLSDASTLAHVRDFQEHAALAGQKPMPPDKLLRSLDVRRQILPGVRFTLSTNPGIVFGLSMHRWMVGIATVATVALVCFFFATSRAKAHLLHAALACVLAGALGNLYDRLLAQLAVPGDGVIRYQVRDFIDCSGLYYPWVFNFADVLLVIGVAMLMLHSFLAGRRGRKQA
ncbi:MAG TPA: signal peptidase II [Phycisphaerae bacterium]|nr:signal peptidase II [Phycisphaerae bacterium]